jgi:hypothetical protein
MTRSTKRAATACLFAILFATKLSSAQQWTNRVRGSWIADDNETAGVTLVSRDSVCDIVVAPTEPSGVQQAAKFLARDIEKITARRPAIVAAPTPGRVSIQLHTVPADEAEAVTSPWAFQRGAWEAFQIRTVGHDRLILGGSNPRGTAFAAYTLAERIGIDPLYHWTGYEPEHHDKLVLPPLNALFGPPTFRYRGMFHDDEDILPRPFEASGYPLRTGDVPSEWYAKYFETALRLRMNMVAPYTRVHRRHEVQKMASDWGLFYTSHHYDILLSNPFGIERFGLAKERGVSGAWDWINNRDGMLKYWRGGVEENAADVDCIWPVGMRGTDDTGYKFPPGMSDAEQGKIFKDVIERQVAMTMDRLPPGKTSIFHWTLYTEMLPKYLSGKLEVPENVIIVWPDDNDGTMRGMPEKKDRWKHGVYYHLAYLGKQVKQNAHIVPPARIAEQFRKIVDAGATEYMLVNVSELREFVMEARMLAEICWDAKATLAGEDPAKRYVEWWCREYFPTAPAEAARAYAAYYELLDSYDKQWFGSDQIHAALAKHPLSPRALDARASEFSHHMPAVETALGKLTWPANQFFFDHLVLPLRFDQRSTAAAVMLRNGDTDLAMKALEDLETDILRAEHPPFENWYRETWIRRGPKQWNVHRPYGEMRMFLSSGGKRFELPDPEPSRRRAAATTTTAATSATSAPAGR